MLIVERQGVGNFLPNEVEVYAIGSLINEDIAIGTNTFGRYIWGGGLPLPKRNAKR